MNKITVSAPGKLMLFGEHAVVYGKPCIVTAVDQRIRLIAERSEEFFLDAPEVKIREYKKPLSELGQADVPKGAQFVEIAVKNFFEKYPQDTGVAIKTFSEFSSSFGFGSSSASTVCTIKALSELFEIPLSEKDIFDLSYKTVIDIQKKGSGFDIAAAIYGGTLYFKTGGEVIEPLLVKTLPLVVGYTGIKADTVTLVNQVALKMEQERELVEDIFDKMESIVEKAKTALQNENFPVIGGLMNENQKLLDILGVGSAKLTHLIQAARNAGAYGAKLSGAGGGDCMIAVAKDTLRSKIEHAIVIEGEVISVTANCQGVRAE